MSLCGMEWSLSTLLIFCKLGGSTITDKQKPATPRLEQIARLADQVREARSAAPEQLLLLGHGSGSFGHAVGKRYQVHQGLDDGADWWGYAATGAAAARLNRIVTDRFLEAGVPVVSVQPSASVRCRDGEIVSMETYPIREALRHGLVPLVHGDVAFDEERGCAIVSTERVMAYLAGELRPTRMILVGEVDGVYDRDPLQDRTAKRIRTITPATFGEIRSQLGESHSVDVTGGMLSKVSEMVSLVSRGVTQRVHLISGGNQGALLRVLLDEEAVEGSVILPHSALARSDPASRLP